MASSILSQTAQKVKAQNSKRKSSDNHEFFDNQENLISFVAKARSRLYELVNEHHIKSSLNGEAFYVFATSVDYIDQANAILNSIETKEQASRKHAN